MKVYCRPSQYYYFTSFFLRQERNTQNKKSTWKGIQSVQKFLVLFIIFMYADLWNSCGCAAVIAYSHLERDWSVQPLEWKLRRSSVDVKKAKLLGVTSEKSACFHFANRGNSHKPTSHLNLIRDLRHSKWRLVAKLSEGEMTCSQTWSASSLAFSSTLQEFI